jgi:hypothetical protein
VPTTEQNYSTIVFSPLEQFEVRNLLSFDAPILGDINLSITNIGLYLTIGALIVLILNILATNYNKIGSNNWSISNESLYATIHSIVVNQINETRGQVYFPFIYTLFIFILINNLIGMVNEMCLYTEYFLFIYQQPTQQANFSSDFSRKRSYSTCSDHKIKLNPYFITGFIDGEGCFHISIYRDSRTTTGWRVKLCFKISMHQKDRALLELIKTSLGVGQIYKHGTNSIELRVNSVKDLLVITNHFDKYPLITQKLADYIIFKRALELMNQKEHLTLKGLNKVVAIKSYMNKGLSSELNKAFPDIIPVPKSLVESTEIKDLNWLAGFIEGEGCFQVVIQKSSTKTIPSVSLRFTLTQHSRDEVLMKSLYNCLGCGRYYAVSGRDEGYFIVSSFSDIYEKIIPFFDKYPLVGSKQQDYLDFIKVAELMKSKSHLTKDGLEEIKQIKSGMNRGRDPDMGL